LKKFTRLASALLVAILAVGFLAAMTQRAVEHETPLSIYTLQSKMLTKIPALGGGIDPATDWSDAWPSTSGQSLTVRQVGDTPTFSITVWIKNDENQLYIAIKVPDTSDSGSGDRINLCFDEDHDGAIDTVNAGGWGGEDIKFAYGNSPTTLIDWYYITASSAGPDSSVDGAVGGSFTGSYWEWELRIPLSSPDNLDLNVKSGAMLGLSIGVMKDNVYYLYPENAGVDSAYSPADWADLDTARVFQAVIPWAHDDVATWVAFLTVRNLAPVSSTVVLKFDDGTITTVSLSGEARDARYVRDWRGAASYIGSIKMWSDRAFCALMNQRNAASTMISSTYVEGQA